MKKAILAACAILALAGCELQGTITQAQADSIHVGMTHAQVESACGKGGASSGFYRIKKDGGHQVTVMITWEDGRVARIHKMEK